MLDLKYILDQTDITDLYRTLHATEAEYTFFSSTSGTFSRIDHIIGHKTSVNKFEIKIMNTNTCTKQYITK